MSGRLAEVEARIDTVRKLAAVISAMRGIAASRAQEARRHLAGIRAFADTIGAAIAQSLALLPDSRPGPAPGAGRSAVVMLAGEQGFAGSFNERVFDAAAPVLARPHDLLLAGDRGLLLAAERGVAVDWSAPMIAHPDQAATLAGRITEAVYATLAPGRVSRVVVVHAAPSGPAGASGTEVVTRTLVPFDYARFPPPAHGLAPRITLPPQELLARLAEEYVFAEIAEAVMLSFAAENEARMRAMIAAHDNVGRSLDTLLGQSRRLRQDEITDEISELAVAGLPVR